MAPSMNPWEDVAIYVPAQWIRPYGPLRFFIFDKTPGGKKAIGPPFIGTWSPQTFQTIFWGANISGDLKYVDKVSKIIFYDNYLLLANDHSLETEAFKKITKAGWRLPYWFGRQSS